MSSKTKKTSCPWKRNKIKFINWSILITCCDFAKNCFWFFLRRNLRCCWDFNLLGDDDLWNLQQLNNISNSSYLRRFKTVPTSMKCTNGKTYEFTLMNEIFLSTFPLQWYAFRLSKAKDQRKICPRGLGMEKVRLT